MYKIETEATYKGNKYYCIFNGNGFRCGYVEVKDKDLFNKIREVYEDCSKIGKYPEIDSLCPHGGITFARKVTKHNFIPEMEGQYIGFDCGHCFDEIDIETAKKYFPEMEKYIDNIVHIALPHSEIRSQDYVEKECKELIDDIEEILANSRKEENA